MKKNANRKARASGLDMTDSSITTLGVEDGLTKKAALASSRHKYIVMEKDKFYFNDSYRFAHFDDINGIITDEMPDSATIPSFLVQKRKIYGRHEQQERNYVIPFD